MTTRAFLAVLALAGVDQLTKVWVRATMPIGFRKVLVPGYLDLLHAPNKGIALSTFADLPASVRLPFLLALPALTTLVVLAFALRGWSERSRWMKAAFVLVLAGAIGNLVDRVLYAEVTDFMRFYVGERTLFVNNVADDFVTVGGAIFCIEIIRSSRRRERATDAPRPAASPRD